MNWQLFQRRSLKTRLTFFTLTIFVVSIWALSYYITSALRNDMQRTLGEQQFSTVAFIAAEIDDEITIRVAALESIAKQVDANLMGKPAAGRDLLAQRPILPLMFNGGVWITGRDGVVIASDLPALIGVNYSDREYMIAVLKEGKPAISKPITGKVLRDPIFAMAVPIRDALGRVIGALAGVTDLSKPNFLDKVTQSRYGKSGDYLLNYPKDRLIITGTDKTRIMQPLPGPGVNAMLDRYVQGYEGFGVSVNSRGVEELTAAKGIPAAGWFVGLVVPTAEAFVLIDEMQQRILWACIVLTLLSGGLTWSMLRRELSPMLAATKMLATLSARDVPLRPLPITSQGEIADLIGGFNRLLKAVAQQGEEQNAIFESATSGIAFIKDRVVVKGNHTLDRLFGYEPGEQVGLTTRRWYVDDEAFEAGGRPYANLARGEVHQREQRLLRKDGTMFWCRLSGSAIDPDDSSRGSVWMITDVTSEHDIVKAMQQAKEAAEAANIAKSRFLATMSHELRTPMNGILGMAQMLLTPVLKDEERLDYAQTVLNSGQTLLTLLNDILDLSKVEAGKFEIVRAPFEPEQIIRETRMLFVGSAVHKALSIEATWHGSVGRRYLGDPNRLLQMLSNLVGNATKFTTLGQIRIEGREVTRDERSAELEFAVADTGIGISEDQKSLLFKPFSQVDSSTTREYGGSGLGLAIVRSMAELMGGKVGVDSEPGKGSRFWFRIRVGLITEGEDIGHQDRPIGVQAAPVSALEQFSGRVLVVEDNATSRKVAGALLTKLGLTVEFAEDGQEAVDAIVGGNSATLILMDLRMPLMDGYAATEAIRQWEARNGHGHQPIIALSADAFEEDRQRCMAAGMDDFLTKPISLASLKQMLGRWLSP